MALWYLSFAGDEGFRGAALVEAPDFMGALLLTKELGINPGGEVMGAELPSSAINELPPNSLNQLFQKPELQEKFGELERW